MRVTNTTSSTVILADHLYIIISKAMDIAEDLQRKKLKPQNCQLISYFNIKLKDA